MIVDAPPVLPVPDALTMGRWTDGAMLAVRFDVSRFALVEQASRLLASAGDPVLGAGSTGSGALLLRLFITRPVGSKAEDADGRSIDL